MEDHTPSLLTHADEIRLAHAIEVGVLAAAARARPGLGWAADADLAVLEREGERAWRRFVAANTRLVWLVVLPVARRTGLDPQELFQEGTLGLLEALQRFDHVRGARFATYALPWIRMRVSDAAATQWGALGLPPGRAKSWRRVRAVEASLLVATGRRPSAEEVARAAGEGSGTVRGLLAYAPAEALSERHDRASESDDDGQDEEAVARLVRALPSAQRAVVVRRYGLGRFPAMTQGEVAEDLRVSVSTVRRREVEALELLRESVAALAA